MKDLSQLSSINMSDSTVNTMRVATRKSSRKTPRDTQRKRKHREKEKAKDGVKTRAKKKRANTASANMGNVWTADRDQLPDSEDEDARMAGADQYVVPSLPYNQEG